MAKIKVKPRTLAITKITPEAGDPGKTEYVNNVKFTFVHESTIEIFFMDGSSGIVNGNEYRIKRIN